MIKSTTCLSDTLDAIEMLMVDVYALMNLGKDQTAIDLTQELAPMYSSVIVQFSPEHFLDKEIEIFRGGIKGNSMISDLDEFINSFNDEKPQGIYKSFKNTREAKLSQQKPSKNVKEFLKTYYISPVLVRSIFERALDYLISINEFELALKWAVKLKTIKPEYDFKNIFSNYENKINKMKLASAN